MTVSDHLNTARGYVRHSLPLQYPLEYTATNALAALDAIEVAWNSAYDLPTPRLVAEVERLRAELAASALCEECGHTLGTHPRVALGERMPCSWERCECWHFAATALAASGGDSK